MKKKYSSPYELDGRLPLKTAIPLGMQHVLAMFIGNLTAPIVILGVCGVASGSPIHVTILSNAMFIAGLCHAPARVHRRDDGDEHHPGICPGQGMTGRVHNKMDSLIAFSLRPTVST